jgi:hypothetical protein
MGHEDAFPRPRLNVRCRFSLETFAGMLGNERATVFIRPSSPAV